MTIGVDAPPEGSHFGTAFGTPFDPQRFNAANVFTLLEEAVEHKQRLPSIFVSVGDDDSHRLWRGSIAFFETMQMNNLDVEFRVTDGDHNGICGKRSIEDALLFVDSRFTEACRPLTVAVRGTVARRCLIVALTLCSAPVGAIVGPSEDGSSVASHVVMVLNRQGRMAGYCSGLVIAPTAVLTAAHCVPRALRSKSIFAMRAGLPCCSILPRLSGTRITTRMR